jgi:hypothetical protein
MKLKQKSDLNVVSALFQNLWKENRCNPRQSCMIKGFSGAVNVIKY